MRIPFTLCLLFLLQLSFAQIEIGTQWTYYQGSFLPPPFGVDSTRSIRVVSDTTIDNKQYFELQGTCACSELEVRWIREENNQMFYYLDNAEHLLYDFNLREGEMLEIYWPFQSSIDNDSLKIHIDSVGQKFINGANYNVQYINPYFEPGYDADFGDYFIQGIGSNYCLFPQFGLCELTTLPLLCFGQAGGEVLEFSGEDCQLTDTEELTFEGELLLFPNPFQNELNVQFTAYREEVDMMIYGMTGQLITQLRIRETKTIDLSDLPRGIYLTAFFENDELIAQRKIVKLNP